MEFIAIYEIQKYIHTTEFNANYSTLNYQLSIL